MLSVQMSQQVRRGKTHGNTLHQCEWYVPCALENTTHQHCPTAVHMKPAELFNVWEIDLPSPTNDEQAEMKK